MKRISRDEASRLLRTFGIIETKIERIKNALMVYSMLSNHHLLLVKYDVNKHDKSYFIKN